MRNNIVFTNIWLAWWNGLFGLEDFTFVFSLTSLNRFLAAPKEVYLSRLMDIFGYSQNLTGRRKIVVILPEDIDEISGKGANVKYWFKNYPDLS